MSAIQQSLIPHAGRLMNEVTPIGPGPAEYCFECAEWYLNSKDWDAHCLKHLGDLDLVCGSIVRFGLVLLGAVCPFCLGDDALEPSQRWRYFPRHSSHRHHINHHIEKLPDGPIRCPHPVCDGEYMYITELDFRHHLHQSHSIPQSSFVRAEKRRFDEFIESGDQRAPQ